MANELLRTPLPQPQRSHPTVEELMKEQGVNPVQDPRELLGDFWPEDEPLELFLDALREWRDHSKTDQAA